MANLIFMCMVWKIEIRLCEAFKSLLNESHLLAIRNCSCYFKIVIAGINTFIGLFYAEREF